MARLRGTVLLDVDAGELSRLRSQLATTRPPSLARGEYLLHDDGRASYSLPVVAWELARVAQAMAIATALAVTLSLGGNRPFYVALPIGFVVGVSWAAFTIALDRRRRHAAARVFLRQLARR